MLSSDALERQFGGPTELEVLRQDDRERIICTKLSESGKILELSRVIFHPEGAAAFPDIHREVVGGKSMGRAFADNAVGFNRRVRASCRYDRPDMPAGFAERFGSEQPPTVTDVSILVGPGNVLYADILEVYSPEVSPWEPVGEISGEVTTAVNAFGKELAAFGPKSLS